jgi:triacylglycerol esterase/lipase EstA (alpha/beta hydrolase family)
MVEKIVIFIQGTDVEKNSNQFDKIFNELKKRNITPIYFPYFYNLPSKKSEFEKGSSIYNLKQKIILQILALQRENKQVTLIGHSFGGLILNSILNEYQFKNIEKIITIATFHKLKSKISQRIKNLLPFNSKQNKLEETKNQLNLRKDLRQNLKYKDISSNNIYKNICYTIGFSLDPIVPLDSTKMLYSKHKIITAEHGFLFRKSSNIINEILDFSEI